MVLLTLTLLWTALVTPGSAPTLSTLPLKNINIFLYSRYLKMKLYIISAIFIGILLINEIDLKSISYNHNGDINNSTATGKIHHQHHHDSKHTTITTTRITNSTQPVEHMSSALKDLISRFMKKLKSLTDSTIAPQKKKEHILKLRKLQDEIKAMLEKEPALYYIDIEDMIDADNSNSNNNKTDSKSGTIKKPFKWG